MAANVKFQYRLEFVKKAFEFSNEIVQVIKYSFGPNGLDTLVSTTSGTLLLTNDGFQMFKSLSCGRPVGKLMLQGLDLFYKSTGDFCKKFILLIRELLAEVLDVVSVDKTMSSEQILCISQGMDGLLIHNLPQVFDKLQSMGVISECLGQIDDVQNPAISILKMSINGKFSPKTCEVLVSLLQELFLAEKELIDTVCLRQATIKLLDSFSEIVFEVPGKPLTSSTVLSGIIIPREFLTMVKKLPRLPEADSFKFVILGSSSGYELPQSTTVLSLKDSQQVNRSLEWRRQYIEKVVKRLAEHGVEMIITSAALHDTFIHICNQYHMAAVHLIPQEDIMRISDVFGTSPLFEFDDDSPSFIAVAASCKSIQVGRHTYVYLEPPKTLIKQVLLCAPTEALCHQYSIALQNMLRTLRSSFKERQEKSHVLSYVPGGGAFELALAFTLEEHRKLNMVDPNMKLACQILEKSLLSIPWQLAVHLGCKLSLFDMKALTRQTLTSGNEMFGISRNGRMSLLNVEGVVEPTVANYLLLSSVLQLFVQILRTDNIVHVKSLPLKNVSQESDDSDSEVDN